MRVKRTQQILRVAIFLIFLYIISRLVDIELLKEIIHNVRFDRLLLAVVFCFFNIAIRAYRWGTILNKNEKYVSFTDAYIITLIGVALNIFIPATLGDIAKSYYGYKMYGLKEEILSASLVDKMFALGALFVIGTVSGVILRHLLLSGVSFLAACVLGVLLIFPRVIPWNGVNRCLRLFKRSLDHQKLLDAFTLSPWLKVFVLIISLCGWLFTGILFYVVCSAFPVQVSLGYILLIMPVLTIVRLFPFTVNALGPVEVAVAYFFEKLGIPSTFAVLISLTVNMISYLLPGAIGLVFILTIGDGKRQES